MDINICSTDIQNWHCQAKNVIKPQPRVLIGRVVSPAPNPQPGGYRLVWPSIFSAWVTLQGVQAWNLKANSANTCDAFLGVYACCD